MDIQTRKKRFVQRFLQIQDEKEIEEFEQLLEKKQTKSGNPISLEEFYADIDKSLRDIQQGKTISAQQLKAKIETWD